eukprot:295324_1
MSLLLLSTIITLVNSLCDNKTITCTSYNNASISKTSNTSTTTCKHPATEVLVSCGIKIDSTANHTSTGIEMTDNYCRIQHGASTFDHTDKTLPIPIARCCNFASCFPANFDCKLSVKRRQFSTINSNCKTYPYLFSCALQTNQHIDNKKIYQGIWYSNSTTNLKMRKDYCNLFNIDPTLPDCATDAPTSSPTSSPTRSPTEKPTRTTSPPTALTKAPIRAPTAITKAPTKPPTSYIYEQSSKSNTNECTLERHDGNQDLLWLYSFCCSNSAETFAPTVHPTPAPTIGPTSDTNSPSYNKFSDTSFEIWNSPIFPLTLETGPTEKPTAKPTVAFSDVGDGYVDQINWGVSNEWREYKYDNGKGISSWSPIFTHYYFTIKKYQLRSGKIYKGEYGQVYLPDGGNGFCENIPMDEKQTLTIVAVHVYVNESTKVIEGMTMIQSDGSTYTCHVDMARKQDNSTEFQQQLFNNDETKNPKNTLNVSGCTDGGLAGFLGTPTEESTDLQFAHLDPKPRLGIGSIQFQFVALGAGKNCPVVTNAATTATTAPTTTLPPTPGPTIAPTAKTAAPGKEPTAKIVTPVNADLDFKCYWVMANGNATCDMGGDTVNIPFMTSCVGYSITGQPNSWYIEKNGKIDKCIVEAFKGNTSKYMAAIATCCYLKTTPTTESACEKNDKWYNRITWTKNEKICENFPLSDLLFSGIVIAIVLILALWGGGIAFCVIQCRKGIARREKEKRLKKKPLIKTIDGEQIAEFTDEQIEDRLALERLKVNEKDHREMLQQQRLLSSRDIGLI